MYLQSYETQYPPVPNSLVSLLPCPIFPFNIIPQLFAPRLTSKILQIRLTARIGEDGQSY
jgi:hypothetical protein